MPSRVHIQGKTVLLCLLLLAFVVFWLPDQAAARPRPNIIVVQVDDMSTSLLEAQIMRGERRVPAMPNLLGLGRRGASFDRYYASLPLCGPSRASLLTGQMPHNHGLTTNNGPRGFEGWVRRGTEEQTLPVWLSRSGYRTTHIGKYLNEYGKEKRRVVPPGWSHWVTPTHNNGALYYGAQLNVDGRITGPQGSYESIDQPWCRVEVVGLPGACRHSTDLYTAYVLEEIQNSARNQRPFYIQVDFNAPHDDGHDPAGPARQGALRDLRVPAPPGNLIQGHTVRETSPEYLKEIPRLDRGDRQLVSTRWRNEVASLHGVDLAIGRILKTLKKTGEIRNTYLVFLSDNGIFHGENRITYGKYMPQEPSTRQPLIINGPGVRPGDRQYLSSTPDITATILDLARVRPGQHLDGRSLEPILRGRSLPGRAIVLEGFTGKGLNDPRIFKSQPDDLNSARRLTFRGFVAGPWKYIRYAHGDEELYNVIRDPNEQRNLAGQPKQKRRLRWARAANAELVHCTGEACRPPEGLHFARRFMLLPDERRVLRELLWTPGGSLLPNIWSGREL